MPEVELELNLTIIKWVPEVKKKKWGGGWKIKAPLRIK